MVFYDKKSLLRIVEAYPEEPSPVYVDRLCLWRNTEKGHKWWSNYYNGFKELDQEFWDEIYRISLEMGVDFSQYKSYNIEEIEDKEYESMFI